MSYQRELKGLYVITDDSLTPEKMLYRQVESALRGGATIVQLRDKQSSDEVIAHKALRLQELCHKYNALFVLNDKIELAISLGLDGLHIGKSDHHRFSKIRELFEGIIGVSCYGDISLAQEFEKLGADYVAFGSFYSSPTKPDSSIVSINTIKIAKNRLDIPICVIGGISTKNLDEVMHYRPDMVSVISDIWSSADITQQSQYYSNKFQGEKNDNYQNSLRVVS